MASSSAAVQQGPRKVALVVGIQNYDEMKKVSLTLNDAKLVAETLQNLEYLVTLELDLTNEQLQKKLYNFGKEVIEESDIVFLYFAGHAGAQLNDNVLFGVDSKKANDSNEITGISFGHYLLGASLKKCTYILILDAHRVPRSSNNDAFEEPLPVVDPQISLMMPKLFKNQEYEFILACQPNKCVIEDVSKENGSFARALCDGLKSAIRWDDVRLNLIKQVKNESENRQIPFVQTCLTQTLWIKQFQSEVPSASNVSAPQLPILPKVQAQQEISSTTTLSNIVTPQLPFVRTKLWQITTNYSQNLLQFCEQLKSKGTVENAEINVSDQSFYSPKGSYPLNLKIDKYFFNIDLSLIEEKQIFIKNLTFIQHKQGNDKRQQIVFYIRPGQHLVVSHCNFNAIGLRIDKKFSWNSENICVQLSDINVSNTTDSGLAFWYIDSVSLNRIQIKNCIGDGFFSAYVENIRVENAKISQCDQFGMGVLFTNNFFGLFIEVERCGGSAGLYFKESKGELKNIEIRDCKDDIYTSKSEIEQTDVRKL